MGSCSDWTRIGSNLISWEGLRVEKRTIRCNAVRLYKVPERCGTASIGLDVEDSGILEADTEISTLSIKVTHMYPGMTQRYFSGSPVRKKENTRMILR
jgi:hypothetical protein